MKIKVVFIDVLSDSAGFFFYSYKVYRPASLSYVIPIVRRSAGQAERVLTEDVQYPASRFSSGEGPGTHPGSRYASGLMRLGPCSHPGRNNLDKPLGRQTTHFSDKDSVYG